MPRFVILSHDWPLPHLDLLLESDGVLRAWRLPSSFQPDVPCLAEANADHRLFYLDYEGPVSGNRGTVAVWDSGEIVWELVESSRIVLQFQGNPMQGRFELLRQSESEWRIQRVPITSDP